jgi:small subunit ribosomal protein S17
MANAQGARKTLVGTVIKTGMNKTVTVSVDTLKRHAKYGKFIKSRKKYMAHDEKSVCGQNDRVLIVETKPLSKMKNWRVTEILEKAK